MGLVPEHSVDSGKTEGQTVESSSLLHWNLVWWFMSLQVRDSVLPALPPWKGTPRTALPSCSMRDSGLFLWALVAISGDSAPFRGCI